MTGVVLLFCNGCGIIFGKVDAHKVHYFETCPYCGIHDKVAFRRKGFILNQPVGKRMVVPQLQRFIIASPANSHAGFLLKLRFGEGIKTVA